MFLHVFLLFFQSGLTQACLDSPYTLEFVADKVLQYIKKWIPRQRIGVLAGNSVHFEHSFEISFTTNIS
jgi:oligoribonuclease